MRPLAKADLRCTRAGVAAGALFDVAALFVLLLIASKRFPWGGGDPSEAPAAELVDLFDAGYWTGALQNLSSLTASHWLIALGAAAAFPLVGVVGAAALWRWALWVYAAFLVAAITLRTWVIFQLRHPPLGGGAAGAAAAGVLPAELSARALRSMLVLTICIFVDVALFQSASRLALLEGRRRAQVDPGGGGGGAAGGGARTMTPLARRAAAAAGAASAMAAAAASLAASKFQTAARPPRCRRRARGRAPPGWTRRRACRERTPPRGKTARCGCEFL